MLKKLTTILLALSMLVASASAETLSQFMFKSTASWSVIEGQPSLFITVNLVRRSIDTYEAHIKIKERGGSEASINRIMVHMYDEQDEVETFESNLKLKSIDANGEEEIAEVLHAQRGQWIGYEVLIGNKSYYGIAQCGDYTIEEAGKEIIE